MDTEKAIKLFGSVKLLAEALGITNKAVYQWGKNVPALRAYEIKDILQRRKEGKRT